MRYSLRKTTTAVFWGLGIVGLIVPGCSNRLRPVNATQSAGGINNPNLPNIVVERSKECMEMDGRQLGPGRVVVESSVTLDEAGNKVSVNVPKTAGDFGSCMRNVFLDMPIAERPFQEAVEMLHFQLNHAGDSDGALRELLNLMPGVPIIESELMLEAHEYTAVLPVTVKVAVDLEKICRS